jgi:stearoyl-CoA desaturase (delta-9 desaturase)
MGCAPATDERTHLNDVTNPSDIPPADNVETEFPAVLDKPKELASVRDKLVTLLFVIAPFAGLVAAIIMMWGRGFSLLYLILMGAMYVVTALGITVGYHRLFTHRSFETSRFVKAMFAIMGSMAIEGPMLRWVANHRRHHQHSDHEEDPHSPHHHGEGLWGLIAGFYHAHVGWIFDTEPADLSRYVGDLVRDRWLRIISGTWFVWALAGLVVPAVLGGLISHSWLGVLLGFLWGGLVRVFFVHHVTWSVNSVCHLWGSRPFNSHDLSRNNAIFGILAFGEGWHNNHHAFPTSARHGLRWWQIDFSYWVIWTMSKTGLAWKVRIPAAPAMDAKRMNASAS